MPTDSQTITLSNQSHRKLSWLLLFVALVVVSFGIRIVTGNGLVPTLSDVAFIVLILGIIRILPPKFPAIPLLLEKTHTQLQTEAGTLLRYALLFPLLLIPVVTWGYFQNLPLFPERTTQWALSWNYLVVGKIFLLTLPTIYFIRRYGGNAQQLGLRGISNRWRWITPIIILFIYIAIACLDSFSGEMPVIPLWPAVVVIVGVFLGAGFAEEFFYRVLLQTRLEALLGRWNGIAITSLLFALLHLPSRLAFVWLGHTGNPSLDLVLALSEILTVQGVRGFLDGYLWSRYRNAWINVLSHTLIDVIPLVLLVAGALIKPT